MFDPLENAFPTEWLAVRGSDDGCGSCGADLFPSTTFVWHFPDKDCRGVKQPLTEQEQMRMVRDSLIDQDEIICMVCGSDEHHSNCDTQDPQTDEEE